MFPNVKRKSVPIINRSKSLDLAFKESYAIFIKGRRRSQFSRTELLKCLGHNRRKFFIK